MKASKVSSHLITSWFPETLSIEEKMESDIKRSGTSQKKICDALKKHFERFKNDEKKLKELLNARNKEGKPLFFIAAEMKYYDVVLLFFSTPPCATIHLKDGYGRNVLEAIYDHNPRELLPFIANTLPIQLFFPSPREKGRIIQYILQQSEKEDDKKKQEEIAISIICALASKDVTITEIILLEAFKVFGKSAVLTLIKEGAVSIMEIENFLLELFPQKEELAAFLVHHCYSRTRMEMYIYASNHEQHYDLIVLMIKHGAHFPWFWKKWREREMIEVMKKILPSMDFIDHEKLKYISDEERMINHILEVIPYEKPGEESGTSRVNPLEIIFLTQSDLGVKQLMFKFNFLEFSKMFTKLMITFPKANTDFIWDELLSISLGHYNRIISQEHDQVPVVSQQNPNLLVVFFNNSIDPEQKQQFANLRGKSVKYIEDGLKNIADMFLKMDDGFRSVLSMGKYRDTEESPSFDRPEWGIHVKRLNFIIWHLQLKHDKDLNLIRSDDLSTPRKFFCSNDRRHIKNPLSLDGFLLKDYDEQLSTREIEILINMGAVGLDCFIPIKDTIFEGTQVLLNKPLRRLNLEDRMRALCEEQRLIAVRRILGEITSSITSNNRHDRDNIIYHLKDKRGLPSEKPASEDIRGKYFGEQDTVINKFDKFYNTTVIMTTIINYMGQDNDMGRDFSKLVKSWFFENLALHADFPCPASGNLRELREVVQKQYDKSQVISYENLEDFFRSYDGEYKVPRIYLHSYRDFCIQCKQHPLLRGLLNMIKISDHVPVDGCSLFYSQEELEKRYNNIARLCLFEEERDEFDLCVEEYNNSKRTTDQEDRYKSLVGKAWKNLFSLKTFEDLSSHFFSDDYTSAFKEAQQTIKKFQEEEISFNGSDENRTITKEQFLEAKERCKNIEDYFCIAIGVTEHISVTNGKQFFESYVVPLIRDLNNTKDMNASQMKEFLLKNADHIFAIRDSSQTVDTFICSTAFTMLRNRVGESIIEQSGICKLSRDTLLTDFQVKRCLISLFFNTMILFPPHTFEFYIDQFHKDIVNPHIWPTKIEEGQQKDVYTKAGGTHPLFLAQLVVQLLNLEFCKKGFSPYRN